MSDFNQLNSKNKIKQAAQGINDLAGCIFSISKGVKNAPALNIKANSKAMRLNFDFRSNVEKWHSLLMSDNHDAVKACEYLHSRRISDDTIKRFKLLVKQEFYGLKYYRLQRVKKSSMKGFAEIAISEGHGQVKEAIKETGPSQARRFAGMEARA